MIFQPAVHKAAGANGDNADRGLTRTARGAVERLPALLYGHTVRHRGVVERPLWSQASQYTRLRKISAGSHGFRRPKALHSAKRALGTKTASRNTDTTCSLRFCRHSQTNGSLPRASAGLFFAPKNGLGQAAHKWCACAPPPTRVGRPCYVLAKHQDVEARLPSGDIYRSWNAGALCQAAPGRGAGNARSGGQCACGASHRRFVAGVGGVGQAPEDSGGQARLYFKRAAPTLNGARR